MRVRLLGWIAFALSATVLVSTSPALCNCAPAQFNLASDDANDSSKTGETEDVSATEIDVAFCESRASSTRGKISLRPLHSSRRTIVPGASRPPIAFPSSLPPLRC